MGKMTRWLKLVIIFVLGSLGSTLYADNDILKLEEQNNVVKLGYGYVNDNSERTDKYSGYFRYKKDVDLNNNKYTIIPVAKFKYRKTDNVKVNNKYSVSILAEHLLYDYDNFGLYSKVSYGVDDSNNIDNRIKYGLGLYQYVVKRDNLVIKVREGLQYADIEYNRKTNLSDGITYFKLGSLIGYKLNDNVFLKLIADYDIGYSDNDILDVTAGADLKITNSLTLETLFTYNDNGNDDLLLSNTEKELVTSIVYNF